jgi:hypothetical protein
MPQYVITLASEVVPHALVWPWFCASTPRSLGVSLSKPCAADRKEETAEKPCGEAAAGAVGAAWAGLGSSGVWGL